MLHRFAVAPYDCCVHASNAMSVMHTLAGVVDGQACPAGLFGFTAIWPTGLVAVRFDEIFV